MKRAFKTSVANCNYSLINDIQAAMRYRSRGSLNGASVCELGMISIKGFISLVYTKSHFKVYFREKEEQKHLLLKHHEDDRYKAKGKILYHLSDVWAIRYMKSLPGPVGIGDCNKRWDALICNFAVCFATFSPAELHDRKNTANHTLRTPI